MPNYNLKTATDDITTLTNSHAQVKMCRWGTISDVANPKDGIPPAYPYVFYIIDQVNYTRRQYKLQITGIFMTRCKDTQEEILQAQSDMADISRDIYAKYIVQSGDAGPLSVTQDLELEVTPFVERFQDTVAGVTVRYYFELDVAIGTCYFPTKD